MKKHASFLFFIISLTILAWHKVISQSFLGEGFQYFNYTFSYNSYKSLIGQIATRYDAGIILIFDLFKQIFRDNIMLYMDFMLVAIVFLNVFFYALAYQATKHAVFSLVASILFSVNFAGYEMFGIGNYQFFMQRAFPFLLLFPSATFYTIFIKKRKMLFYVLSLSFFTVAIFFFNFSFFFLPFYLLLTLTKEMPRFEATVIKRYLLKLIPFIYIGFATLRTGIMGQGSSLDSTLLSLISFFTKGEFLLVGTLRQLLYVSLPESTIVFVEALFDHQRANVMQLFYIPLLTIYVLAMIFLLRYARPLQSLAVCAILFVITTLLLNLYVRHDEVAYLTSGSRYLYVPSIGFSLFWGAVLVRFFFQNKLLRVLGVIFLFLWCFQNVQLVWQHMDRESYKHRAAKSSLRAIKSLSSHFKEDTIIIVPSVLGEHGANFCQLFYGKANTSFLPYSSEWNKQMKRPFNVEKDIIFEYDYQKEQVVNLTKEFKRVIKEKDEVSYKF